MYGVASGVHMPVHMHASMPEFVGSCYTGLRHNLTSVPGLLMSSVQSIRRFAQTSPLHVGMKPSPCLDCLS